MSWLTKLGAKRIAESFDDIDHESCKSCKYSSAHHFYDTIVCRRMPPTKSEYMNGSYYLTYPFWRSNNWCGEYKRK